MSFPNILGRVRKQQKKWYFQNMAAGETTYRVPNPSCGWYRIYPFTIPAAIDEAYLCSCLDDSQTLCMIELCLENYPDRELDEEALTNIREILSFFASQDVEMIVRPTYDLAGDVLRKEPQKAEIIAGHLRQLGKLFREFREHIFMVQGLLLGNWGEMHGSRYMTRQNVRNLYAALREAVGKDMWIALRRPRFVRWITLDPSSDEKICLFNDAILSSETDMGTYSSSDWPGPGTWFDTWTRDKEIDFQRSFCLNRPNGGEAALAGMPFAQETEHIQMILQTMLDMHIGYMNSQYDTRVFGQWKKMEMSWPAEGNLYDEIVRRVGYRFVVSNAEVKGENRPETIEISVRNAGFSNFLSEGELDISMEGGPGEAARRFAANAVKSGGGWKVESGGTRIVADADTDPRTWYTEKTAVISQELPRHIAPGTYRIWLNLFRKSDHRVIRFANKNASPDGSLLIGELTVN